MHARPLRFPCTPIAANLLLGLAACAAPSGSDSAAPQADLEPTSAPFTADGPSGDSADRACGVVLRTARRVPSSWGGWETSYSGGQGWTVWEVQADFDAALLAAGAEPMLLFQGQDTNLWWEQGEATLADGLTPEGMVRYAFRIDQEGLSEPFAPPAYGAARISLIPALRLPDGTRLFDHNRIADPLASYTLDRTDSWLVLDDSWACWGETGRPVRLMDAQVSSVAGGYGSGYAVDTVAWGTVQTGQTDDPWASVWVHYRITDGNSVTRDWTDAPAEPAGDGLWTFALPSQASACPHYCYSVVYQLAVATWSDGVTSWDNLAGFGTDYQLAADFGGVVPVFRAPVAIVDGPVKLSWARWDGATFSGEILLRNLDYQKRATVVFSTDGWATVRELDAQYARTPMSSELEYWRFSTSLPGAGATVRFALRYEVAGQTFWDNNLERDWALTATDGQAAMVPAFD